MHETEREGSEARALARGKGALNQARLLNQRRGRYFQSSRLEAARYYQITFLGDEERVLRLLCFVPRLQQQQQQYQRIQRGAAQTVSSANETPKSIYLWSGRASSINISASLAFNYTIIEGPACDLLAIDRGTGASPVMPAR